LPEKSRRSISFLFLYVNSDATFEILYVPPGRYTLNLMCSEKSGKFPGLPGKQIAAIRQDITVPAGTEKLDLSNVLILPTFA